jgi:urease accessory protein
MRLQSALATGIAVLALLVAPSATAHLVNDNGGLFAGVAHPFLGVDHVLAMVAVGLWAGQTGRRALWAVPLAFVTMMAGGSLLAISGVALPAVEAGVAASVLALGLLVALAVKLPLAAGMALTGAFALFHGHSHGAELPAMASSIGYALGFLVATSVLHMTGVAAARFLDARRLQIAGACVAVAGAALIAGL